MLSLYWDAWAAFAGNRSKHHMEATCIIFPFHNTLHSCFLPPSYLPTTFCDGKIIHSAVVMIFMLFFSVFVATLPSISHFCIFFHLPLPSTPVEVSVSVFLLFWYWYFLTYLTPLLLLFCPVLSINPTPASFFALFFCSYLLSLGLLISALGFTLFFCSYLISLGLSISALGLTLQNL